MSDDSASTAERTLPPLHFGKVCRDMIHTSTADWVFAQITSVPTPTEEDKEGQDEDGAPVYNHYYGFAEEVWPTVKRTAATPRNIWFKLATHTKEGVQVGPVRFGIPNYKTLPVPGEIVVGKVVGNVHRNGVRFQWWSRDAQPLKHLVRISRYGTNATKDALCLQSRLMADIQRDNLWALIRLVAQEDLESFVQQYLSPEHRQLHPIRLEHGPRGYLLDRSPHRFLMDVARMSNCPQMYVKFEQMLAERDPEELVDLPTEEERQELRRELEDLEESAVEESYHQ
jgi:hypothetical protein